MKYVNYNKFLLCVNTKSYTMNNGIHKYTECTTKYSVLTKNLHKIQTYNSTYIKYKYVSQQIVTTINAAGN